MITSYILDLDSLTAELSPTSPKQQQASLRHLLHWARGLKTNGVLFFQRGWLGLIENALRGMPEDKQAEVDDILKDIKEGLVSIDMPVDRVNADCLIGSRVPHPRAKESCSLVEYLDSATEKKREGDLLMQSFSNENSEQFEAQLGRVTKYAKKIVFVDKIWGEKIDEVETRKRFAYSFARMAKSIAKRSAWPNELRFTFVTSEWRTNCFDRNQEIGDQIRNVMEHLQKRNPLNGDSFRVGVEEMSRAISSDHKGPLSFSAPTMATAQDALRVELIRMGGNPLVGQFSIQIQNCGHDRYLITDHHVLAFGKGFDIYATRANGTRLSDINIYFVGHRTKVMRHISDILGSSQASDLAAFAHAR